MDPFSDLASYFPPRSRSIEASRQGAVLPHSLFSCNHASQQQSVGSNVVSNVGGSHFESRLSASLIPQGRSSATTSPLIAPPFRTSRIWHGSMGTCRKSPSISPITTYTTLPPLPLVPATVDSLLSVCHPSHATWACVVYPWYSARRPIIVFRNEASR